MKITITFMALSFTLSAIAGNSATESPITMQQLMRELQIQGGNWQFQFDTPVYARIKVTTANFPNGDTKEETVFTTEKASADISLFFMDSPDRVGDYTQPNHANLRKMKFKLSDCSETDGTRIITYYARFSTAPWISQEGTVGHYKPAIAQQPELNKEYVLNYYYRDGDPYSVLATISFAESVKDLERIERFEGDTPRRFKITGE